MGSISYLTDSPSESPSSPEDVLPFTILANRGVHTRNGYHCRALLLPYPHSLCSAILEPAFIRTLLPDFFFLASFQLGLGPVSRDASASSTVPGQHDDDVENILDPDPYSDPRPLHRRSYNPNHNRNSALQQLSTLTHRETVFLYPEGGNGPEFLLRHGPNPQLVRAPGDDDDDDDDDTQSQHRPLQLYPRLLSPTHDRNQSQETEALEDTVRQMITHRPERRLEMAFDELIRGCSHPSASSGDDSATYGLATTTDDGPEDPDPYPFRVPGVCFRIPNLPHNPTSTAHDERADVMALQRSRFLRTQSDGEEATGMVLGIAIHSILADAARVEVIVARLRREILREVGGVGWDT